MSTLSTGRKCQLTGFEELLFLLCQAQFAGSLTLTARGRRKRKKCYFFIFSNFSSWNQETKIKFVLGQIGWGRKRGGEPSHRLNIAAWFSYQYCNDFYLGLSAIKFFTVRGFLMRSVLCVLTGCIFFSGTSILLTMENQVRIEKCRR